MWNEQTVANFWRHSEASFVADTTASEIVRLSKKYIRGKTLDVGAGSGALIDRIPQSVGIDLVSRHPMVIEGSVDNMPFETGIFETVFLTDVLEHLPDAVLQKGMREISRVMKPTGKLIIVAPYRENLDESKVYCPVCGAHFHRAEHLRSVDEFYLVSILRLHGFNVLEMRLIPLAFTAKHWIIRYLWPIAVRMRLITVRDLFVVAEKC